MSNSSTLDPANSDIDKVRINIADTDPCEELISKELYQWFLDESPVPASKVQYATIKAVGYLVARYAGYTEEETNDVKVKYQFLYQQYKDLQDRLTKDPSYSLSGAPQIYAGGISCSDIESNNSNSDNNQAFPAVGWISGQFK